MRTYTRKRTEFQVIEGAHEMCRLCLGKPQEAVPIFTDSSGNASAVAMRIMICVGLEISADDCLPNKVCLECHRELERCYSFRKKCEVSYLKLKSHLQAVRKKELNKEIETKEEQINSNDKIDVENKNRVPPHLFFSINYDGTVRLCEENSLMEDSNINLIMDIKQSEADQSYITNFQNIISDTSNKDNYIVVQRSDIVTNTMDSVTESVAPVIKDETNVLSEKTVLDLTDETVSHSKKIVSEDGERIIQSNDVEMQSESTELQLQDEGASFNISTLLSNMLIKLGILSHQGDALAILSPDTSVQLETAGGDLITLELIEEDEVSSCPASSPAVSRESAANSAIHSMTVDNTSSMEGSKPVIQYVTSDNKQPSNTAPQMIGNYDSKIGSGTRKGAAWCEICGKTFASRSVAARHVRGVHARERPFQCRVCARRFTQKEVLTRHELVHKEHRPHKCTWCPKSFTQRGALEVHVRSHAPPHARALNIHQCTHCSKVFLYASGLSRHLMTHTGRVHACSVCSRQFKDKSSLKRHLKSTHHPQPEPEPGT